MKKRHILLVDDDVLSSTMLEKHLQEEGFEVTVADTCAEGRKVLGSKSPVDLLILDQMLPDGTGVDLLMSLANSILMQRPPVIMSSSFVDPKNTNWDQLLHRLPPVSQALIQAYVPKPYTLDNLDAVVSLVFEASPGTVDPRTMLAGDYHHPRQKKP